MSEVKVPTCPFCEKQHGMDQECVIKDLKQSMTGLLAKYLKTAPMQTEIEKLQSSLESAREVIKFYASDYLTWWCPADRKADYYDCVHSSDIEKKVINDDTVEVGGKRAREWMKGENNG